MTPMVDTSPEPRSPLDDKADFGIGGWLWLVLGAPLTVPQFIMSEIQDARRLRKNRERAKSILDHAYCIDPAHPLIHLAVAMVEDDEQSAAFLRDYDLKRLPESCAYTKDLDPKEVVNLAIEMCAEQGDEAHAQMARAKLEALEGGP
jgi:hypothetical protein